MTDDDLDHIPIEQRPAKTLMDVARTAILEPLKADDHRYVDMMTRSGSNQLGMLRDRLDRIVAAGDGGDYVRLLLSGHRGSGKTTELLHLEKEVSADFTSIHLDLDQSLRDDFDYSLFCLWLTEQMVAQFADWKMGLPKKEVEAIARWYAEHSIGEVDVDQITASLEINAEAKARFGWAGIGLAILTRAKMALKGDHRRREEVKRTLRNFTGDLMDRVNQLFISAQETLQKHNKPTRLLIVQDNLDRLSRDAAIEFFYTSGDVLQRLKAHFILTAPTTSIMAPHNIEINFPRSFIMPTLKIADGAGKPFKPGEQALIDILSARADKSLFKSPTVMTALARYSGGSARDLVRLLDLAAGAARVGKNTQMDKSCVAEAAKIMRHEYEQRLIPGRMYFPWLAEINRSKDECCDDNWRTREKFSELLQNGAVLAYRNDRYWYDIHPVIRDSHLFKNALAALPPLPADG